MVAKAISKFPTNFFDLFVVSSISLKTLFVCSPIESIKGIRVSISALNFLKSNLNSISAISSPVKGILLIVLINLFKTFIVVLPKSEIPAIAT